MKLVVADDYEDLSRTAAAQALGILRANPRATLVCPTGNTPVGFYGHLAEAARHERIAWSEVRLVGLDEYAGIGRDDPRRFSLWLKRAFLDPAGIPPARFTGFDPAAEDGPAACARIDKDLTATGIDLQILGLGLNGHIGFNEPGSPFDSPSRRVALTPESIRSNAAYWGSEDLVPRKGYTLGLATLATAKATLLLVSGRDKAEILAATLQGEIGPHCPATLLRRLAGVTVIADEDAVGLLA